MHIEFDSLRVVLRVTGKRVLAGVTGQLRPAELTAIMGPSGAGKHESAATCALAPYEFLSASSVHYDFDGVYCGGDGMCEAVTAKAINVREPMWLCQLTRALVWVHGRQDNSAEHIGWQDGQWEGHRKGAHQWAAGSPGALQKHLRLCSPGMSSTSCCMAQCNPQ